MKLTRYITRIGFAAMLLTVWGCQNDGPIGYKFGVWRVDSYTVDNQRIEDPLVEATTIAFQGAVINVVARNDDYMGSYDQIGTWTEEGDKLYLNFTHSDDMRPPGTDFYHAPWWLGWTSEGVMEVTVEKQSNRDMTWRYVNDEGKINVYKLHKTW